MNKIASKNTVVIFSHGFGIQKDNLGLFTYLTNKLNNLGLETHLFDYYKYNKETKEIYTIPFSKQAEILQNIIKDIKRRSNKDIIVIGHSQGSIIPTLIDINDISMVIGISPFFMTNREEVYKRYSSREGSNTNFNSISKRKHSNGQVTVIYPEYWEERFNTNQYKLYNSLNDRISLKLIYGTKDKLVDSVNIKEFNNIDMYKVDADHDFTGEAKDMLWDIIKVIVNNYDLASSSHRYSKNNSLSIKKSNKCGCFFCLKIFLPSEIKEYTDNNETAICPYCNVDSIICDYDIDINKQLLKDMKDKWFGVRI